MLKFSECLESILAERKRLEFLPGDKRKFALKKCVLVVEEPVNSNEVSSLNQRASSQ